MEGQIGVRQLVVGVYKARIKLQGVTKFDRGLCILSLLHVLLTNIEISRLRFLWIARARDQAHSSAHENDRPGNSPPSISHDSSPNSPLRLQPNGYRSSGARLRGKMALRHSHCEMSRQGHRLQRKHTHESEPEILRLLTR